MGRLIHQRQAFDSHLGFRIQAFRPLKQGLHNPAPDLGRSRKKRHCQKQESRSHGTLNSKAVWFLVGNGGMDPYSSPHIIPNNSPQNPFPHSRRRTRQKGTVQSFGKMPPHLCELDGRADLRAFRPEDRSLRPDPVVGALLGASRV